MEPMQEQNMMQQQPGQEQQQQQQPIDQELVAAEMRLRVPSKQESPPIDTAQLMEDVKEPVLDNDYKSILLDITKMVAQARFIMSRAFVGGQLGSSSFLEQGSIEGVGPQGQAAPSMAAAQHVSPMAHDNTKIPARPHRVFKGQVMQTDN